ncbi:MAG TPA: hypothetical protein VE971_00705 [Candidatus Eisenbacteria bacterium]|nr:hypothetical protein [Candidatus Eisenbacteria bacterium]
MRTFRFYSSPFVLDKSKLGRIDSVIKDQFDSLNRGWRVSYTAVLKSKKVVSLPRLDSMLSMDNSINDPINSLHINAEMSQENRASNSEKDSLKDYNDKSYYDCDVHFSKQSAKGYIMIDIGSSDNKWADSTLLALEEQIERTLQRDVWTKYCNSDLRFVLPIIMLMSLIGVGYAILQGWYDLSGRMWLTKENVARLLSEEGQNFNLVDIHRFQLKNLQYYDKNAWGWNSLLGWKFYVILIPVVFIIGAFFYLILRCYPVTVFNWGDMSDSYEKICRIRKTLWQVIMIAIIGGFIVNIAASGFVGMLQ